MAIRKEKLGKAALARTRVINVQVDANYEPTKQKVNSLSSDFGVTYDGNYSVTGNQIKDDVATNSDAITVLQNKTTPSKDTTANRPASPTIGQMYFDTTLAINGKPIWYNGTDWVDATGAIV